MRVRLPPSVISTIESHLKPDFSPVSTLYPLYPTLDPTSRYDKGKGKSAARPEGPAGHLNDTEKNSHAGPSSRISRPLSDPIPIYGPHLFRTASKPQYHLALAQKHLMSESLDPTSPSSMLRRQVTYSRLITTFLDHPQGLKAIRSLLAQSMHEGVPISVPTLTSILRSVLSSTDVNVRVQVVHSILPLLPEKLDIPLLDVLLRTIIRDTAPEPDVVEKMITDCLKLEDRSVENRKDWPLEVWDLLALAYAQKGDMKALLKILAEFKEVVQSRMNALPSSSSTTSTRHLDVKDRKRICKVYTIVLDAVRQQSLQERSRNRSSLIQRRLAKDLVDLLGGQRPSTGFLNAWLRAERALGEMEVVSSIWQLIGLGKELDELDWDRDSGGWTWEDRPDSDSWTQFFALYQSSNSATSSSISTSMSTIKSKSSSSTMSATPLPPLRSSLQRLFAQAASSSSSASEDLKSSTTALLTTPLINSILRALFHPSSELPHHQCTHSSTPHSTTKPEATDTMSPTSGVDLPAILTVMGIMRRNSIQTDRKTIDLLSSGLMNMILSLSQADKRAYLAEFGINLSSFKYRMKRQGEGPKGKKKWLRMGLGVQDWDLVSDIVHLIRVDQNRKRIEQEHQRRDQMQAQRQEVEHAEGEGEGKGELVSQSQLRSEAEAEDEYQTQVDMVYLPLSMPIGRLTPLPPPKQHQAQNKVPTPTPTPPTHTQIRSQYQSSPLTQTQPQPQQQQPTRTEAQSQSLMIGGEPRRSTKPDLASTLLSPLITLGEQILLFHARNYSQEHRQRAGSAGRRDELLKALLGNTERELFPKPKKSITRPVPPSP